MIVSDVLKNVAKYLGDNELDEAIIADEPSSAQTKIINYFIDLINIVQQEVAGEYLFVKTKEAVTISSDYFEVEGLSKTFYKMIKVIKNNEKEDYYQLGNKIYLPNGKYEIHYQYLPANVEAIDNVIDNLNGKITDRILAYGVVSEYCLIKGMYDTADVFEQKFKNCLFNIKRGAKNIFIPKRRWL